MSHEQWAALRKRLYLSIPFVQLILSSTVLALTDETWHAITGMAAIWLLPLAGGVVAAKHVDLDSERQRDVNEYQRLIAEGDIPRRFQRASDHVAYPDLPYLAKYVACAEMHGSAEPHVKGCAGWRQDG